MPHPLPPTPNRTGSIDFRVMPPALPLVTHGRSVSASASGEAASTASATSAASVAASGPGTEDQPNTTPPASHSLLADMAHLQASLQGLLTRAEQLQQPHVTLVSLTQHLWPTPPAVVATTEGPPQVNLDALIEATHAAEHAERTLRPVVKAHSKILTSIQAAVEAMADYPRLLQFATTAFEAATVKAAAAGLSRLPTVNSPGSAPSSSPSSRRTSGHTPLFLRMPTPRLPLTSSSAISPSPSPAHRRTPSYGILSPARAARTEMDQLQVLDLVQPHSLLAVSLPLVLPQDECIFCPDSAHGDKLASAGKNHFLRQQEYMDKREEWMAVSHSASAEASLQLPPESNSPTSANFQQGLRLAAVSEGPDGLAPSSAACALIGISLTSYFDEAHLIETILFCSQRFKYIRFVIITDPYICSQTQKQLAKAGAWGVGMPIVEALNQFDLPKMRTAAQKLILQKFRIVRRAVEALCGEKLSVSVADLSIATSPPETNPDSPTSTATPDSGGRAPPRFAWIQWSAITQLPLYQQMRQAIGERFHTDLAFRTEVLSVAHHPVQPATQAEAAAERELDARLSSAEVDLFADYFLSEHAFLACLPTLLQCPGDQIFLPYHCNSRALPFIISPHLFNPTALQLVDARFSHSLIGLAVLPTQSSLTRTEFPSASSTPIPFQPKD